MSKQNFTRPAGLAGGNRVLPDQPRGQRTPRNQRDLGLALRARDHQLAVCRAARIAGTPIHAAVDIYTILRSLVSNLYYRWNLGASAKQLVLLCKVLGLDAPPELEPITPPATRVLPLKPPRPLSFE